MKARLKESHDYLTLSIPIVGRSGLNLTINWRGTKISAPMNAIKDSTFEIISESFDRFVELKEKGDYGARMRELYSVAEKSADINDFAMKLQSLSKG